MTTGPDRKKYCSFCGKSIKRRPANTIRAWIALMLFAFAAPVLAAPQNPCKDPRIPQAPPTGQKPKPPTGMNVLNVPFSCKSEIVSYRRGSQIEQATLIRIHDGTASGGDHIYLIPKYFLLTPAGEVVALGTFPQLGSVSAESFVLNRLEIGAAMSGGTCCMNQSLIYERLFEMDRDRVCTVYRMKPPFVGEASDCDGSSITGNVGYQQGAISWPLAIRTACKQATQGTALRCTEWNEVSLQFNTIRRDASGALYYVVAFRRDFPPRKEVFVHTLDEYDYVIYRVNAADGSTQLLEKTLYRPNAHKWVK